MSRKKKIALVIPSLIGGGMERVMSELANYFVSKENTEIHLILYGRNPSIFYDVNSAIHIHKPQKEFNNRFRFFGTLQRMIFLRKIINEIRPTSILSFGTLWNRFVLLSLYGLDYPVFVSDRGSPDEKYSLFQSFLYKKLYPRAKGIITQTEYAKEKNEKNIGHKNIITIGNPISIMDCKKKYARENIVLSVGRLIQSKHHDLLIKYFAEINPPNWQLIIVGGDAMKQNGYIKLKRLIHSLGMDGKIILKGEHKDLDPFYLKSKIFAFTSSSEGFPNVIGEALSAGLPVITFDCIAGPSEMVKDGHNGYLIDNYDKKMFQNKLCLLMEDEKLCQEYSKNAVESIKKFEKNAINERFFKTITNS